MKSAIFGAISSLLSAGFFRYGGSIKDNTAAMVSFSTVSGGGVSALTGGNFWEGATTAFYVSMLNHAAHKITEDGGNQDPPKKSRSEMTSTEKDYAYMKDDLLPFNKFMLDAYLFLEGAKSLWGATNALKAGWEAVSTKGVTFYRAMSNAEYVALQSNNGLTYMAGKELFVSSSANYSRAYLQKSGYDVLVKFSMKPGAMNYFQQVGVMHRTAAGASGWAGRGNLLWKSEQGAMNLGIQQNTHMFNPWINSFKAIK